uniref:hypothetical protein n=1 Tax=Streptomyces polyasparticus TaxID=2767826 RepID=UPI001F2F4339|nr:hypothetical protein [Streptomyces polyasparticus]
MSHLTRDKVVDEWLAEAELAVRAAREVVAAAERELQAAQRFPKWRPEADLSLLPRDYPKTAQAVKDAGLAGIRAIEVHRLLGRPDTDGSRQNVRNRLQRLSRKGWLRLVSRGVYGWAGTSAA